jgi:hypothetical protein
VADVEWGNAAEWVGAVGTVAAFFATFVLLRIEVKARREDRLIPARSMSVSLEVEHFANQPRPTATVWVHNGAVLPMRQVTVHFADTQMGAFEDELGELGPDRRDSAAFDYDDRGTEPVRAAVEFVDPWGRRWRRQPNGPLEELRPPK